MLMKTTTKVIIVIFVAVIVGSTTLAMVIFAQGLNTTKLETGNIALIRIEGTIQSSTGVFDGADPTEILPLLRTSTEDPNIKAVVLRINSPGGQAAASQEIYREVMRVRNAGKPVVASIGDMAASGGYYVASAADKIISEPGAMTGSIGVISTIPQLTELLEKLGIEYVIIKGGEFKDIGSPYREITPEEKELLQDMIDDVHDQFINDIAAGRGLDVEDVRKVADGRILTGRQAKELGLTDEFGNLYDAIDLAAEMAGVESPTITEFQRAPLLSELLKLFSYEFGRAVIENLLSKFETTQ
jgi:protease-4